MIKLLEYLIYGSDERLKSLIDILTHNKPEYRLLVKYLNKKNHFKLIFVSVLSHSHKERKNVGEN